MSAGISWGRWPRYQQDLVPLRSRFDALPDSAPMLPHGNGRSYGDVCLNAGGSLLITRGLDRFMAFDAVGGILECEAGVLLSDIIDLVLPRGWFPAVTPGTAFVTVGGAIANDVHGKNHHRAGSFGHHLLSLELQRSDGQILRCSADEHQERFHATIGGLGLTGLILTARLKLRRVAGPWIVGDSQRFASLPEFFALAFHAWKSHGADWRHCQHRPQASIAHPVYAADLADHWSDGGIIQRVLLPPRRGSKFWGLLALRGLSIPAGWNPRMESHLWPKWLLPISMCPAAGRGASGPV